MNSINQKTLLRYILVILFLVILIAPGYVFFANRGGLEALGNQTATTLPVFLFPLFGLYAFTFLWTQFLIGSSATPLRYIFPQIVRYHRLQGIFVLILAVTHPALIVLTYGFQLYLTRGFLPEELRIFALFGQIALYLLLLTVLTARFANKIVFLRTRWRYIHYLNYLIFTLVWIHSWNLGSDIRTTNLKYLWVFFGVTAAISAGWRLRRALSKTSAPNHLKNYQG